MESILRNGQKLNLLVKALLELSDMESSTYRLKLQRVNVAGMLEEVAGMVAFKQKDSGPVIEIGNMPSFEVMGDVSRILQIFQCFMDFCVHDECKKIVVDMQISEGENTAGIRISNTDDPIDITQVRSMFSAESSDLVVDNIQRPVAALGLAIAASLIIKHEGNVEVQANDDDGLTFEISFSAAPEQDSA